MGYGFIFGMSGKNLDEGPIPQTRLGPLTIYNNTPLTTQGFDGAFVIKSGSNGLKFGLNQINGFDSNGDSAPIQLNYGTGATVEAPSFSATSSRTKKENIEDFDASAIDIINQAKIVSFNYIQDPEHERFVGFISEDTPTPLSTADKKHMSINSCIGMLLKAVQELDKKVNELEEKLQGVQ